MNHLIERLIQDLRNANEALLAAEAMSKDIDPYRDTQRLVGVHWILSAKPAIWGDLSRLKQILAIHKDMQDVIEPNDLLGTAQRLQQSSAALEETIAAADQGKFTLVGTDQAFSELLSEVLEHIHVDCQGIYDSYTRMKN